jgi:nitrogen fixation/metabolism regulation signal transduction histidine kinase
VARRLAHEIKNPLTPIQLSAERLRRKLLGNVPEAEARIVERATHTIGQQVQAMKAMVDDFTNYARAPEMQEQPFGVDALIGEVLELYRASKARVTAELGAPDAKIRGDSKRLRQVVHNLLKNAIEALDGRDDGVVRVCTQYAFSDETPSVEISIEDNGGGIGAELMDRLFEPYVTSKARGTGLGLAIVKKIIEEHGGMISAENAEHGARFTARLPVWREAPAAAPRPPRQVGES